MKLFTIFSFHYSCTSKLVRLNSFCTNVTMNRTSSKELCVVILLALLPLFILRQWSSTVLLPLVKQCVFCTRNKLELSLRVKLQYHSATHCFKLAFVECLKAYYSLDNFHTNVQGSRYNICLTNNIPQGQTVQTVAPESMLNQNLIFKVSSKICTVDLR